MPKKKTETASKRRGTLIRVSDAFAEAIADITGLEKTNAADFADAHLLPVVKKRYREVILKKARAVEEQGSAK